MDEAPLQRNLKVGKVTIGLVGLDVALNRVLGDSGLDAEEAARLVYEEISRRNYVPPTAGGAYRAAIAEEIKRLRQGEDRRGGELVIRILGPGCVSCNNLQKMVIEIMNKLNVAADIFQIHDLDEIGRYGIMQTPALIINGRLKSAGRLPTSSQIEEWLREAHAAI